jgi:hypothetical protein
MISDLRFWSCFSGLWCHSDLQVGTNISEKHTVSFFMVEKFRTPRSSQNVKVWSMKVDTLVTVSQPDIHLEGLENISVQAVFLSDQSLGWLSDELRSPQVAESVLREAAEGRSVVTPETDSAGRHSDCYHGDTDRQRQGRSDIIPSGKWNWRKKVETAKRVETKERRTEQSMRDREKLWKGKTFIILWGIWVRSRVCHE